MLKFWLDCEILRRVMKNTNPFRKFLPNILFFVLSTDFSNDLTALNSFSFEFLFLSLWFDFSNTINSLNLFLKLGIPYTVRMDGDSEFRDPFQELLKEFGIPYTPS